MRWEEMRGEETGRNRKGGKGEGREEGKE